jgi:hypothetical protein
MRGNFCDRVCSSVFLMLFTSSAVKTVLDITSTDSLIAEVRPTRLSGELLVGKHDN